MTDPARLIRTAAGILIVFALVCLLCIETAWWGLETVAVLLIAVLLIAVLLIAALTYAAFGGWRKARRKPEDVLAKKARRAA